MDNIIYTRPNFVSSLLVCLLFLLLTLLLQYYSKTNMRNTICDLYKYAISYYTMFITQIYDLLTKIPIKEELLIQWRNYTFSDLSITRIRKTFTSQFSFLIEYIYYTTDTWTKQKLCVINKVIFSYKCKFKKLDNKLMLVM